MQFIVYMQVMSQTCYKKILNTVYNRITGPLALLLFSRFPTFACLIGWRSLGAQAPKDYSISLICPSSSAL